MNHIAGVGLGLDLTRRNLQDHLKKKSLPWTLSKSFNGAAMVSPFVPISRRYDLYRLSFEFRINDVIRQQANITHMMNHPLKIMEFIGQSVDLYPGDVIFTGTPDGVGVVTRGDRLTMEWTQPWRRTFYEIF